MTEPVTIDQNYLEKYKHSDWMETHTGLKFWPARPRIEDINALDIAHALALKCRYGGHSKVFYSVAEHCYFLASYARILKLPVEVQFHLLMHDASEAYLPDVPRPIKHFFPDLLLMEKRLDTLVRERFGLGHDLPLQLKEFDSRIIKDERCQVMFKSDNEWQTDAFRPLGVTLAFFTPAEAETRFLHAYQVIGREFLKKSVLLTYGNGEFLNGVHSDARDEVPNLQLVDLVGKVALAKKSDGTPYHIHGEFDLAGYGASF